MHNRRALITGESKKGAKEKAISDLDSRLFVIPENWHRKRNLKCHIRCEAVSQKN